MHRLLRGALVLVLVLGPPALGAVTAWAYVPLLVVAFSAGTLSWALGHWERAHGHTAPRVPLRGLLFAFHLLVLLQLVPLPPGLLHAVSPGSFAFYSDPLLLPLTAWKTISVSPPDTLRGFAFLLGMTLLYALAWRESRDARAARWLAAAVVAAALANTLTAFVQAGRGDTRIYGLIQPRWAWAVFGPYVNRNHYAGHIALALPLAFAAAFDALSHLRAEIRRTQRGWLLLAEREGSLLVWHLALAGFLVAGLVASRSRGGAAAFLAAAALLLVATRRERGKLALLVGFATLVAAGWAGMTLLAQGVGMDAVESSRLVLWREFVRLVPHFPLFGSGFDAFDSAYLRYQTINRGEFWAEAHNEYLQVLIDTGVTGLALLVATFVRAGRGLAPALRGGPLGAGLVCSVLAGCLHALVDYNWQIPANAATFAVLLGLALGRADASLVEPESAATHALENAVARRESIP